MPHSSKYFFVDVEADGSIAPDCSMLEIGIVVVDVGYASIEGTHHIILEPLHHSDFLDKGQKWVYDNILKHPWEYYKEKGKSPIIAMTEFRNLVLSHTNNLIGTFISDNLAFDWGYTNYYFEHFLGRGMNPFGFSGRRLGDLYCGSQHDLHAPWKHLRVTQADHNPVNDAMGNAEVFIQMIKGGLIK